IRDRNVTGVQTCLFRSPAGCSAPRGNAPGAVRAASTFCPALIIRLRVFSSSSGTGNVFHVSVFAKRRRDSSLPPIIFREVMNIDEELNAHCDLSESSTANARLKTTVHSATSPAVEYGRFSLTTDGAQRKSVCGRLRWAKR